MALTTGVSVEEVEAWPERIRVVTVEAKVPNVMTPPDDVFLSVLLRQRGQGTVTLIHGSQTVSSRELHSHVTLLYHRDSIR